jgi:hypothetical protein
MNKSHRFGRAPLLPEPIRAALAQLVPILKATGSPWVLGGSCSLALHGVQVEPHDVDVSTDRDGAYRISEALRKVAEEKQAVQWGESERIRSHAVADTSSLLHRCLPFARLANPRFCVQFAESPSLRRGAVKDHLSAR